MLGLGTSPPRPRPGGGPGAPLRARHVVVRGRSVAYAEGGRGLPVLFLHGWALDHQVYLHSLQRLVERGCRVLAPSMPGFGGSADACTGDRSPAAYAAWADAFLSAVGQDEPVLVVGHSFGGGVATRLAHDFPDRVRSLVLLNSVGDPRAFTVAGRLRTVARPPSPRAALATARRPTIADVALAARVQRAVVANAVRNPVALAHVAVVAATADLRPELEALSGSGLPVVVMWSDRDGLIPLSAFEALCATLGTDGQVTRGGHSWLLTNPDVLGEVLDNVIHLEGDARFEQASAASASQLRRLLRSTTVPGATVDELVDGVHPLWLHSGPPAVLAGDLALCHPALAAGEVRAVARPADDGSRVTVVAGDRPGLLADSAATLAAEGLAITSASVTTWPRRGLALHALSVSGDVGPERWDAIGRRLAAGGTPRTDGPRPRRAVATVEGTAGGATIVRVVADDVPGLLSAICRWFADQQLSILAAHVESVDGAADDVFVVDGPCDAAALAAHLQDPAARGRPLAAVAGALGRVSCRRRPTWG